MNAIGPMLRLLRERTGISQGEAADWLSKNYKPTKPNAISAWELGNNLPNAEQLIHLCDLYRVDNVQATFLGQKRRLNVAGMRKLLEYADLLGESSRYVDPPEPIALRMIRLYDLPVSAGLGEYMFGDNYEMIEADATVPLSADFGVRVSGDSMYPRFSDRQVVWVHGQPAVDSGEIGIFFYDGDAYIKKFVADRNGARLVSINAAYDPIARDDSDLFRVFGKVVG
jgi:phage repressor protein C with HTH and peptisase S24 domain